MVMLLGREGGDPCSKEPNQPDVTGPQMGKGRKRKHCFMHWLVLSLEERQCHAAAGTVAPYATGGRREVQIPKYLLE